MPLFLRHMLRVKLQHFFRFVVAIADGVEQAYMHGLALWRVWAAALRLAGWVQHLLDSTRYSRGTTPSVRQQTDAIGPHAATNQFGPKRFGPKRFGPNRFGPNRFGRLIWTQRIGRLIWKQRFWRPTCGKAQTGCFADATLAT